MERTLRAIEAQPGLELQLVVTGMHFDRAHGRTIDDIRKRGWRIDATVPWKPAGADLAMLAEQTGVAVAKLARTFEKLRSDIVLVVGDRVEAFAAASAGHLCGRVVAHVHGGDRAQGQVDDALRHAITKLAHVHFAATTDSARRIVRMGEDRWRVHVVGSPGLDGIREEAWPLDRCAQYLIESGTTLEMSRDPRPLKQARYVLLLYHPTDGDEALEHERVMAIDRALSILPATVRRVLLYPNNDPGSAGIVRYLEESERLFLRATPEQLSREVYVRNLPRGAFLGLLRDAAVLIGNSSSGIIEASNFGTPVIDVGDRQKGRLCGANVTNVPFRERDLQRALKTVWNGGKPLRFPRKNPYARGDTARRIARLLAAMPLDEAVRRKLIAY